VVRTDGGMDIHDRAVKVAVDGTLGDRLEVWLLDEADPVLYSDDEYVSFTAMVTGVTSLTAKPVEGHGDSERQMQGDEAEHGEQPSPRVF
jgi:hypothetical protein